MLKNLIADMLEKHQDKMLTPMLADIPAEKMTTQPIAGMNHPAWLLGHLLGFEQKVITGVMGKTVKEPLDATWWDIYGIGSTPKPDLRLYKPKTFYIEGLKESVGKIAAYIRELSESDLQRPLPDPDLAKHFPNIANLLIVLPTHRAYHTGQLATWRKAVGLPHVGM
ncbi:MAG: DinB family protein [Phycisphaerae bacterium]